jgi:hypothetical protein
VVLSHLEFDLLWEDLGNGDMPYPLSVPSHGETMAARDELGATVFAALGEAGLADEHDVAPELIDLFELLSSPVVSVDALVVGDEPWRLLAAVKDKLGVLAVLDSREVALEPFRGNELVPTVVRILGEATPGPGGQMRLPRVAFSAAMDGYARGGYAGFETALSTAGITGRTVRPLATLVTSARYAAGQLAVNGPGGRSPVTSWFDTEAGRYAVTGEDLGGEAWVTVTPADGSWIADRIASLVAGFH